MGENDKSKEQQAESYNRAPIEAPPPPYSFSPPSQPGYNRPPPPPHSSYNKPPQPPHGSYHDDPNFNQSSQYNQPGYGNVGYNVQPGYPPPQPGYPPAQPGYGYQQQQQPYYNPAQDPNVLKITPDLVNITQAPPEHLNPQYQEYLRRDPERIKNGDYPNQYYKHGAPLDKGHKSTGGSSGGFPGRSGATYHGVANR
ncbi:uncharacterized protein J8A68_002860 [[Candida] subhashii]|uniref:Uncharacterized protein n=1 Tax=[Candida] subhashii TaxID=561895 RepID=A0A8J5QN68_9ASCO|nr:uncharacterized protein J8A68_002860 [[Candida] subhashii]KAG7663611.1 hypothetical protein J8A68_002860 [[Candida] subhashii]